jgi:hypothetical protein
MTNGTFDDDSDEPLLKCLDDWRDIQPRILNHRFIDGKIHFFLEDSGWVPNPDASAQERYWSARDSFSRMKQWPREINSVLGMLGGGERGSFRSAFLLSESISGEDVLSIRSVHEVFSHSDLETIVDSAPSLFEFDLH